MQWVLSGKPKNPTRINLVHSGGFGVLLKTMLLVIWVLGMQGTMSLCMMLSSMLVMVMSMKSMAMRHFMMMSRFMVVTCFMGFMGLFMMVGSRLVMLSSVVVVMFGHIFPYQLTKQNAKLIHIAPLHYKNN